MMSFRKRRGILLDNMEDGVAIIPSATLKQKSNDTDYPFRQDSNFKYLTGFHEPDSILVLAKNGKEKRKSILFLRPKDPKAELWNGRRLGVENAPDALGVDLAFPIQDFEKELPQFLLGHSQIYMDFQHRPDVLNRVSRIGLSLSRKKDRTESYPHKLYHLPILLGKMRLIKDEDEIESIKKALDATQKAHLAAMAFTSPGRSEGEVQTLMEFIFQNQGAHGYAYDSIVAGGDNANILHYTENTAILNDGELLLIDAGSEHDLYASDITRTFPVNGKFTEPQKIIYDLVLKAQKKSLEAISPEATLKTLNDVATEVLVQGLIDLKILKGPLKQALENQKYKEQYWPHSIGHWLGLDVHDIAPHLYEEDNSEVHFRPGMVFTVEPGLYLPKDDESLPPEFRGIGIRIEDNILITKDGYENLSAHIPKEISEVEEACSGDYRKFLSL